MYLGFVYWLHKLHKDMLVLIVLPKNIIILGHEKLWKECPMLSASNYGNYDRWGSHGLMVRVGLTIQRLRVRVSGQQELYVGGVNVQRSLHLQCHDWGALEQVTKPPTAPRVLQHKWLPTAPGVFSLQYVCSLDRLNAEQKFWLWITILGRMSRHFVTLHPSVTIA